MNVIMNNATAISRASVVLALHSSCALRQRFIITKANSLGHRFIHVNTAQTYVAIGVIYIASIPFACMCVIIA